VRTADGAAVLSLDEIEEARRLAEEERAREAAARKPLKGR
jgi:hypothetical protein